MTRVCVQATWDDVPHLSEAQKASLLEAIPEHQRDARTKGVPMLGSGRVFTAAEDKIACDPFEIPKHFAQINGLDFGIDHPFAAVRNAWDRDNDIWYVCAAYREQGQTPPIHAAAVKPWGDWIPCAWPHDGLNRDKGSGDQLSEIYRTHGLNMLPEHATHAEGGTGVEAGIIEMQERMQSNRFKVFRTLSPWFEEYRIYHRKNGLLVKLKDDLLSASRYAIMMKRFAAATSELKNDTWQPAQAARGSGGWMS